MQFVLIILRFVHIVAGAFWVGSLLLIALVLDPSMEKGRPPALPMLTISKAMGVASLLTIIAGAMLYAGLYGFNLDWIVSPIGLGFTLGAIAGIAAWLVGTFSTSPAVKRVAALGAQIQAAGGPPSPEQITMMQRLQASLKISSTTGTLLSTIALVLMAIARYL